MISVRSFVAATALAAVTACSTTTVTTTGGANRHVLIVNNTGYTMTHFYGSNAGTNSWEEDILGVDVLPSGSSVDINFDDGTGYCTFDFKAVFSDGDEVIQPNVNVCSIGTFTFN
jgi:hypothetical protein